MYFRTLLLLALILSRPINRLMAADAVGESSDQREMKSGVVSYYTAWKKKYLRSSVKVPEDYKIAFNPSGATVSEAMGYGMLITLVMADNDPEAKEIFDGLDRFRKRYPSKINPAFMCWKIPASEKVVKDDSATDGDMDMALALLMAHRRWGDEAYLREAKIIIQAMATTLVRNDDTLRLGDWDTDSSKVEMIRTSDIMPTHFRIFQKVTEDERWLHVEDRSYAILRELQKTDAPTTGLIPDFAVLKAGSWCPAKPGALEGPHDGDYSYNACRVPWRIGWTALVFHDDRAIAVLKPLMTWGENEIGDPMDFKAGYHLDGKMLHGADFDSPCFIAPTGVAALALGHRKWSDAVFAYGLKAHEGYYEDSVNLLSLLVMSGKAGLP